MAQGSDLASNGRVVIAPEKLRDYLLNTGHHEGGPKAIFFTSLGYRREAWAKVERDIRDQIATLDITSTPPTSHGQKYLIAGELVGPSGSGNILTVWMIDEGEVIPRFITAYPWTPR